MLYTIIYILYPGNDLIGGVWYKYFLHVANHKFFNLQMNALLDNYDVFLSVCSWLTPKDILMMSMVCRTFAKFYSSMSFPSTIIKGGRSSCDDYFYIAREAGIEEVDNFHCRNMITIKRLVCLVDCNGNRDETSTELYLPFLTTMVDDPNVDVLVKGDSNRGILSTCPLYVQDIKSITFFNGYKHRGMIDRTYARAQFLSMLTRYSLIVPGVSSPWKLVNLFKASPTFRYEDCCSGHVEEQEPFMYKRKFTREIVAKVTSTVSMSLADAKIFKDEGILMLVFLASAVNSMFTCLVRWEDYEDSEYNYLLNDVIGSVYDNTHPNNDYSRLFTVASVCYKKWTFFHKALSLACVLRFGFRRDRGNFYNFNGFMAGEAEGRYNEYNRYVLPGEVFDWGAIFRDPGEDSDDEEDEIEMVDDDDFDSDDDDYPIVVPHLPPHNGINPFILPPAPVEILDMENEEADGVGNPESPEYWYIGEVEDELVGLIGGKRAYYSDDEQEEETNVKHQKLF